MCAFFVNLYDLFAVVCTVFHEVVGVSGANHNLRENPCKPRQKKLSKFTKEITYVNDMMIHKLVK